MANDDISQFSKFSALTTKHLVAATSMLQYLRNAANLVIQYRAPDSEPNIRVGYTDSNLAGYPDDRKSTRGALCTLARSAGGGCEQSLIALSMVEAKHIVASDACPLPLYLRRLTCRRRYPICSPTSDPMCLPICDMLADIRHACRYAIFSPTPDMLADMRYARRHPMCSPSPISDMFADIRYARRHPIYLLTSDARTGSSLTGLGLYARIQGKFSDGQRVKRLNKFLLSLCSFFGGCTLSPMSVVFP
jgi:hypothetical protein